MNEWNELEYLAEILLDFFIGRLLFNNELDNLDKQPNFESTLRRTSIRRVSVNYGHRYA